MPYAKETNLNLDKKRRLKYKQKIQTIQHSINYTIDPDITMLHILIKFNDNNEYKFNKFNKVASDFRTSLMKCSVINTETILMTRLYPMSC